MLNNIKFAFFGTPEVAKETLDILKNSGFIPSVIITSPDKPQGRKLILTPPAVKTWAEKNKIPFIQPEKIDKEFIQKIKSLDLDLNVVVAYGKILPLELINLPKFGSINVHYSLLPRWRGASPVESAILAGDEETGVVVQQMVFEMDKGPIISEEKVKINETGKARELKKRLVKIGGELLVKTLPNIVSSSLDKTAQDESKVTYSRKIKKEDGLIEINAEAKSNYNKFRAYADWPRTFFFHNGKRIIITEAVLDNGKFKILKVLPEGKREIEYSSWQKSIS